MDLEGKPNLAKAVIACMREIDNVEKNSTVGTGSNSYKAVGDKDVKTAVRDIMADKGLCLLPIGVEANTTLSEWEAPDYNKNMVRKQQFFTEVKTQYLLLHESGESVVLEGYGHGVDPQDKAAGKATTYALKYTLLYAFLIPTGDIEDADKTHSKDLPVPPATPSPTDTRPYLNKPSEEWNKAIDYVKGGGKIAQIQNKYRMKTELLTELKSHAPKST